MQLKFSIFLTWKKIAEEYQIFSEEWRTVQEKFKMLSTEKDALDKE